MRTKEIIIDGTTYLLTFSNGVLADMEEHGIKLSHISDDGSSIGTLLKMITYMINAGSEYAELKNLGTYPKITERYLGLVTNPESILELQSAMTEVMTGTTNVKAEPPKNASPTQVDEMPQKS